MVSKYFYTILFLLSFVFFGCENYVELEQLNDCFSINDLSIKFKSLNDSEHQYVIEKLKSSKSHHCNPIKIKIGNKFQVTSGLISVIEGEKYKIKIVLTDNSANPLLLYSFWQNSITEIRYRTFNGENGNPPRSKIQLPFVGSKTFEEEFTVKKNENYIMIRMFCEKGEVTFNEISIEKLN